MTDHRMTSRDGRRSPSDERVAWSVDASTPSVASTTIASAARQIAVGDARFAQSAPFAATAGAGRTPHARLTATGMPAAHVQRTGAVRAIATDVPATSATSTGSRSNGRAAPSASKPSGTIERAISRQSPGTTRARVHVRRCCR